VRNKGYGFYCPYNSQKEIVTTAPAGQLFTLVTPDLENSSNWVVCEVVEVRNTSCKSTSSDSQQESKSNSHNAQQNSIELEIEVLRKVGVLRTDFCGEIVASESTSGDALRNINALFV